MAINILYFFGTLGHTFFLVFFPKEHYKCAFKKQQQQQKSTEQVVISHQLTQTMVS
jgi:hypothetical protein